MCTSPSQSQKPLSNSAERLNDARERLISALKDYKTAAPRKMTKKCGRNCNCRKIGPSSLRQDTADPSTAITTSDGTSGSAGDSRRHVKKTQRRLSSKVRQKHLLELMRRVEEADEVESELNPPHPCARWIRSRSEAPAQQWWTDQQEKTPCSGTCISVLG